jgi:ParB family chromosome partitioning protein
MAIRKLGRGLDVLIPNRPAPAAKGREVVSVSVTEIVPNPYQPRRTFPEDDLQDLAASIRSEGLLQPILVRKARKGYQLISGERRLRASRLAELATIPAIVLDVDDRKAHELALVENLQREDLTPLEEAEGLHSLITRFGLTQDALAEALGMKRSSIANSLRLLELPESIRKGLANGAVTAGHAKVLLSVVDQARQLELFKRVKAEGLSVRALEQLLASEPESRKPEPESQPKGTEKQKPAERDPSLVSLEEELTQLLGTKVTIAHNHNKGIIHVHFYTQEDFERLRELFKAAQPA